MTINCSGHLLDLSSPVVMAIVNLTPDSFYDGSSNFSNLWKSAIQNVVTQEPDIIDLGAMSSRPGAEIISPDEEWERLVNVIEFVKKEYPHLLISIDTIHAEVAVKSLDKGVHIINDISGGKFDNTMFSLIAPYNPAYIMMHMKGTPKTMNNETNYTNLMLDIIEYFKTQINKATSDGIKNIILDPGFGFSKTIDQNYKLLNQLNVLNIFSYPILAGLSRKSMIYRVLGSSPKEALNGSSILHLKALQEGARILRVHDVKEAKETITLFEKLSVNK
jgi:dihydropteroate synthase